MIKIILRILLVFGIVILDLVILTKVSFVGVIPNLILLIAIALTIKGQFSNSLFFVLVGSLFLDLVSPVRFGVYTLLSAMILIGINFIILRTIPSPNYPTSFAIFFMSIIIFDLLFFLFLKQIPSWQIIVDGLIQSGWGILLYYLAGDIIKAKEEIEVAR